ncbi:MAG: replication initiator, partial [Solirubrobacteraceae bacterium]
MSAKTTPTGTTTTSPGVCVNPIRLRGYYLRIAADTGEILTAVGSPATANTIVTVACKDRRAVCCSACARLYERDAYQLIAAGLRGGKTVPPEIAGNPAVMVTLTPPTFGAVHGNRRHRPCSCGQRHHADDPLLGTPINPDSYRYLQQVAFNRYAPELWKRTVQNIRRALADTLCVPRGKLSRTVVVRFAKVAEFQRRGVVHYHAIIRLDVPGHPGAQPPDACTTRLLAEVVSAAIRAAIVTLPHQVLAELPAGTPARLR